MSCAIGATGTAAAAGSAAAASTAAAGAAAAATAGAAIDVSTTAAALEGIGASAAAANAVADTAAGLGVADAGLSFGTYASLASSAISGISALEQGNAASGAAKYNSAVQANNATIAKQNASYAGQEGEEQAEEASMKDRAKVATITSQQGASGVDLSSGSSVDVRSSASELGQLDIQNIRANAARKAYGFETEAASDTGQSQLDAYTAKNASTSGSVNAATSLLSGIGKESEYTNWLGSQGL